MTPYPFQPSNVAPFQFQPTLDGQSYVVIVTWNLFGQRYYFNVYDLQQSLIVSAALVGSPPHADIDLLAGYFESSTMIYRASSATFEVSP